MSGRTVPMRFQQESIASAVKVLSSCLTDLEKIRGTDAEESGRELIVSSRGCLLFEAPTGTGKTLMAGNSVEELSLKFKIAWFWFAPFAGLIAQTSKAIQGEFLNLRVKDPNNDRTVENVKSGDVFVTTWQSVAVANTDSRKLRNDSETMLSVDGMIAHLKALGFHIGVVIDEAHHSFRGQTQAFAFYREVLSPDITILATATPRDHDIDDFVKKNHIKHLNRVSVSRERAVSASLIKKGVKVAIFKTPQVGVESLINFKQTALKCGVATHNKLKQLLADYGSTVVPLLLVQVDTGPKTADTAVAWLHELGFSQEQVRVHTADEPDPHLMALAGDERVEVLVFKMAVATGFDAPRAFTLVSMKTSRDPDFGTQIVGRIMRIDRRLQRIATLPEALQFGYVFLSESESQAGLTSAAQRINAVRDELADITDNVAVVTIGNENPAAQVTHKSGQTEMFADTKGDNCEPSVSDKTAQPQTPPSPEQQVLVDFELIPPPMPTVNSDSTAQTNTSKISPPTIYRYPLRSDISFPTRFRHAIISPDQTNLLNEVLSLFRFDDALVLVAQQSATKILMEQVELFANKKERTEEIQATLAQREVDRHAQLALNFANKDGLLDIRALHKALENQLNMEYSNRGLAHLQTPECLRNGVNKILALRPVALKTAIIEATKRHIDVKDAAAVPIEIVSNTELSPSHLNIYGVYPDDLNSWELPFAQELDSDMNGTVLWWHRNPPRKAYSVGIPLPGQILQNNYFPDFIVGVKGRTRGNGILLVETKRDLNDEEGMAQAKSQIEHPEYKKIMMLYWERGERWMVVEYDSVQEKNCLERVWKSGLMVGW